MPECPHCHHVHQNVTIPSAAWDGVTRCGHLESDGSKTDFCACPGPEVLANPRASQEEKNA